jgi:CHAT domain-containing protein
LNRTFVGLGDPIYNRADGRLAQNQLADAKTAITGLTLARLVGSAKEIKLASTESHFPDPVLLSGSKATLKDLSEAIARKPEVIHIAVHVVTPPDQPQAAALALSLKNGMPELLTPEVVASLHIHGGLVVLSGCSSGTGEVVPGAGLVGLGRAWLLAGAESVVVTSWPTPDNSGKFFASFYGHYDQTSGSTAQRAALALSRAQQDMLHGSGYQKSPTFWGAFAVISKE